MKHVHVRRFAFWKSLVSMNPCAEKLLLLLARKSHYCNSWVEGGKEAGTGRSRTSHFCWEQKLNEAKTLGDNMLHIMLDLMLHTWYTNYYQRISPPSFIFFKIFHPGEKISIWDVASVVKPDGVKYVTCYTQPITPNLLHPTCLIWFFHLPSIFLLSLQGTP